MPIACAHPRMLGRMGLLGNLPDDIQLHSKWSRVDRSSGRADSVDPLEANELVIQALIDGERAAIIELDRDGDDWGISGIHTERAFQRRGIASQLLGEAHSELGAHFDEYEIRHNPLLQADSLAWAMSMDGGDGMSAWESENSERIAERFEDGVLAAEHDRHLQALLASQDPAEREKAERRAAQAGRLPEVEVDADLVYVPDALIADMHVPSRDQLRLLREGPTGYEQDGDVYWVAVAGLDKLASATHDGYVMAHVTSPHDRALGGWPDIRNLVELGEAMKRPPVLSDLGASQTPAEIDEQPEHTLGHGT